jgi:hypothetical protein
MVVEGSITTVLGTFGVGIVTVVSSLFVDTLLATKALVLEEFSLAQALVARARLDGVLVVLLMLAVQRERRCLC